MNVIWGVVLIVLGLICWGGQAISWLHAPTAERLGLTEAAGAVEPAFHADVRGEAAWDTLTTWTIVVAGVLLVLDDAAWAYWGLIGGGIYLYFAGRGIFTRVALHRRGLRFGSPENVRVAFVFLAIWGVMALVTSAAAWASLD